MLHPQFRFSLRTLPLALLTLYSPWIISAEENTLRDTIVTANRRETAIDQLSATATRVTDKELEQRLPVDDSDLFRDEPDVAMARDLRRHGSTRVNIRGIEDNRVVQMVDGVRLPDFYNGGGPTNYTMNAPSAPMIDFLRQVEIVRGPASSLYGSDALGGVVGYLTLNPEDIARGDRTEGMRVRGSYFGANEAISGSVIGAWRSEMIDVLLGYAQSRGHETKNKGEDARYGAYRSEANPADTDDRGAIAKFVLRPAVGHRLALSLEGREQETTTNIMRVPSSLSRVTTMTGEDNVSRARVSLEYEHRAENQFYDRLTAKIYHQDSETHNKNYQRRSNARYTAATGCSASSATAPTTTCDIYQDFYFEQKTSGLGVQFESMFDLLGSSHLLTYGFDLMRQSIESKRDAQIVNTATGVTTYALAGETFPLRDFANGVTDTLGLYLQDEIELLNKRLVLTPGIRFDYTRLKPDVDALASQALTNIGRQTVEQENSRFSPKLGAQWRFNENLATFGQIASGFRAPNYNEVNGAFRNSSQLYAFTPNPDLKPETSVGIELGLRGRLGDARGQISVFDNRYKNFIESTKLNCPGNSSCVTDGSTNYVTYMYQNISNVRIYGSEFRASWQINDHWRTDGSIAYARGENTDTGAPINSIDPARLTLGLTYETGAWGTEARMRAAQGKKRIDQTSSTYFRTPGYAVADWSVWYRPFKNTQVVLAVNNLFDQKYWLWSDIRQAESTNPTAVDFYTQAGRNLRVSFQLDF